MTIRTMLGGAMWDRLSPLLPPRKPRTGRPAIDRRRLLEAVLWLARTGAPWRDLPPGLTNWRSAWRRLQRWTDAGVWDRVVDALRAMAADAGWDAPMLDSTVVRAHAHAAGARKEAGGQALGLLRVELDSVADVGSITPRLGGGNLRYDPLPAKLVSRRRRLRFVYHDGAELRSLGFVEARALRAGAP